MEFHVFEEKSRALVLSKLAVKTIGQREEEVVEEERGRRRRRRRNDNRRRERQRK